METLTIAVGPSRRLAGLLAGMHGFAAALLWLAPLPHWLAFLLMPVFLVSAWHTLRCDGFRTLQHSLVGLRLDADCRCEFQTRAGAWHEAALLGSSFVAPSSDCAEFEAGWRSPGETSGDSSGCSQCGRFQAAAGVAEMAL